MKRVRQSSYLSKVNNLLRAAEPWGVLIAIVALLIAVAAFLIDFSDRVQERTVNAWQLLTTRAPGNSGKIDALNYLNSKDAYFCLGELFCLVTMKDRTPLQEIDLSGVTQSLGAELAPTYLAGVSLRGAHLRGAVLSNTNLYGADLTGADLTGVDFSGANLRYADFTGATLTNAILTHAALKNATLTGVIGWKDIKGKEAINGLEEAINVPLE